MMSDAAQPAAPSSGYAGDTARALSGGFVARPVADWDGLVARPPCDLEAGAVWPFQSLQWIDSWYRTVGAQPGRQPLPLEVRNAAGELAAILPLVLEVEAGRRVVTFTDEQLTDYNAPILGPAAPRDAAQARVFWSSVRAALPNADLFALRKSPYQLGAVPNPFALLAGAGVCAANGNAVTLGDDFNEYHRGLGKPVRSEFDRSWRVFLKSPEARFVQIRSAREAPRYLAAMDAQQRARFDETGSSFALDQGAAAAFYRRLADCGIERGFTYLAALECDSEIVATLLAFVQGRRVVVTRLSNAGRAWANCSPGRLMLHRAMMSLHAKGVREFDFSIGNYDYKRRFKIEPFPLFDLYIPLSVKGFAPTLRARAASAIRKYPALDARLRRIVRA